MQEIRHYGTNRYPDHMASKWAWLTKHGRIVIDPSKPCGVATRRHRTLSGAVIKSRDYNLYDINNTRNANE